MLIAGPEDRNERTFWLAADDQPQFSDSAISHGGMFDASGQQRSFAIVSIMCSFDVPVRLQIKRKGLNGLSCSNASIRN